MKTLTTRLRWGMSNVSRPIFWKFSFLFFCIVFVNHWVFSQCTPGCPVSVYVKAIDMSGDLSVSWDELVMPNDCDDTDEDDFEVVLFDGMVEVSTNPETWIAEIDGGGMQACPYVGGTLTARIIYDGDDDGFDGDGADIVCFRTIFVQDANGPMIDCENDTVFCFDPKAQISGDPAGVPIAMLTCDGPLMEPQLLGLWPEVLDKCGGADTFSHRIIRTWRVADKFGAAECNDTIYVRNIDITSDSLVCPEGRDTLYCEDFDPNEVFENGAFIYDSAFIPGYIADGDTIPLYPPGDLCGITVTFEDRVWEMCGLTRTVERTWTIKDLCGNEVMCTDTIIILDTLPPLIDFYPKIDTASFPELNLEFPHWTDTIGTASHQCVGHGFLPEPIISDNCSDLGDLWVQISSLTGKFPAKTYYADEDPDLDVWNVPYGKHIVEYKVVDGCWNVTTDTLILVIIDRTPPVAVCHDALNLSLVNTNENTYMKAKSLDAESDDNCGIFLTLARRKDWQTACDYTPDRNVESDTRDHYDLFWEWFAVDYGFCDLDSMKYYGFAEEVPFCCEDANGWIPVELLLIDYNCNIDLCWGYVHPEDKLPPLLVEELDSDTITCSAYDSLYADIIPPYGPYDTMAIQEAFGKYVFEDGTQEKWFLYDIECGDSVVDSTQHWDGLLLDHCPNEVRERYTVVVGDCGQGYFKREFIALVAGHDGMMVEKVFDTQHIYIKGCPMLAESFTPPPKEVKIFTCGDLTYGPDGNVAIETQGPIPDFPINDCSHLGIGYFDKVFQIVNYKDDACLKVLRTWCAVDWCAVEQNNHVNWADMAEEHGVMTFEQKIIIKDTLPPDIFELGAFADVNNCLATVTSEIDVFDSCGAVDVHWEVTEADGTPTGFKGYGTIAQTGELETGDYFINWKAEDVCKNVAHLQQPISINTANKPSVIGISILTAELNPMDMNGDGAFDTAMIDVWAEEFDLSSKPPCDGSMDNLLYLIARGHDAPIPPDTATFIRLSCDDLIGDPTMIEVTFWVKDISNDSADYINVLILLEDNMFGCNPVAVSAANIEGNIYTETNEMVGNVEVKAESGADQVITARTGSTGSFQFQLTPNRIVQIRPEKDTDHDNGISTVDLIKIQKHILGIKRIESPYRNIAADANRDKIINPLDLIELRKLVLGKIDRLPKNTSWRFVDARHTFSKKADPLSTPFPESITLSDLSPDMQRVNFIGVKIGDLDGNVVASRSARSTSDQLVLSVPDQEYSKGAFFEIPVSLEQAVSLEGFQFTLAVDPAQLEIVSLEGHQVPLTSDNMHFIGDGILSVSFSEAQAVSLNTQDALFTLKVRSRSQGTLAGALAITDNRLIPEGYLESGQTVDLALRFETNTDLNDEFYLEQNYPNPFNEYTTIGFTLPEETHASLRVYDLTGKTIWSTAKLFEKGSNQVRLDGVSLTPGVMYYELNTRFGTATKRMILLD